MANTPKKNSPSLSKGKSSGIAAAKAKKQVTPQRKKLTLGQSVELALECYAGYQSVQRRKSYEELRKWCKEKGWSISPSVLTIGRAISRAFVNNWVEVVEVPDNLPPPPAKRDQKLEDKLLEKYKSLSKAVVLDIKQPPETRIARPGDPFYKTLGKATAEEISKQAWLRPNDIVGIGSGRAVYNTVKFLVEKYPLRLDQLQLMSLTGRAWSRPDPAQTMGYWMDADFHVALFLGMCQSAQAHYMGHPLTYRGETSLLTDKNWAALHPNVALLGVGTLMKNHRFWASPKIKKEDYDPFLRPIYDDLTKLVSLIERWIQPNYSPVADTSNHLFFVPNPAVPIPKANAASIRGAIRVVNEKLLSATESQFRDIKQGIALIAGSEEKALAIRVLLTDENYPVQFLYTDAQAAARLVET